MIAPMNDLQLHTLKDLVLVGGGHSHVIVLKRFGMNPIPGVRLTLVTRDIQTPYSGMLPGVIAGHYDFEDAHIDLLKLAQFAGARLIHEEAIGLNLSDKTVLCLARPPLSYDVLSIDIGVTPVLSVPGSNVNAVAVKPIAKLVNRWEQLKLRIVDAKRALQIGVVGGGAAGVELILSVQHAVKKFLESQGSRQVEPVFHLFSGNKHILPTHNARVRKIFIEILRSRHIQLHAGAPVSAVNTGTIELEDGASFTADEILWATEAAAQKWPAEAGLAVDNNGFIKVADSLQSISHPEVFAAGDIAAVVNYPREKAGVFAVRQGPPLERNLRRALLKKPLRPFVPQKQFLSLISTGDKYAVASRGIWALAGRWIWKWKDRIDRRFMRQFSHLPEMSRPLKPSSKELKKLVSPDELRRLSGLSMRCLGCGSKVGSNLLDRVLKRLTPIRRDEIIAGLNSFEDASVERMPDEMVAVRTVDAFPPIVNDPYLAGQITANHCLGDIYAMGAEPVSALAIVTLPMAPQRKMEAMLEELLSGVVKTLNEAKTALVGGHTIEGNELMLGLAVSGAGYPSLLLRKGGMKPRDHLILTKPLGVGTLFAAHMRLRAKGVWIDGAVCSMLQSNQKAADCLRAHGATACTDITGFGLAGHLLEMVRASKVDAELNLPSIPILQGVEDTLKNGMHSSLYPENLRVCDAIGNHEQAKGATLYPVLFDPQTAGGLMASIPALHVDSCLKTLRQLGYTDAADVGVVLPRGQRDEYIWMAV